MSSFSIGTVSNQKDEVTSHFVYFGKDVDLVKRTGGLESPYVCAIFPLHHGPDREQQVARVELFRAILNEHHALTPELSTQLLNRTRAALESDALKRQAGVSGVAPSSPSPAL